VIAFLFIGQGVDLPWIEDELLADPIVAPLVARASEHARVDLRRVLSRGGRELERSEVLQPAMVAVCLGVDALLERAGVRPAIVLGHSLGELSAWASAGGISREDAVDLAALRGRLMAREAEAHPGGMLRIKGGRAVVDEALALGGVTLGAHNGPDEYAVSGGRDALAAVLARIPSVRLPVAGAWHSPMMAGAHGELLAALERLPRRPLHARFISNANGGFAGEHDLPRLLADQLVHPVQFAASLATLAAAGTTRILTVGPGKTLRALVHRNLDRMREVEIIDSRRAIEAAGARG